VLVTILGWLALLGGIARMAAPVQMIEFARRLLHSTTFMSIEGIVALVLGIILTYEAYHTPEVEKVGKPARRETLRRAG
jgi:hypothetical protein